MKLPTRHQNFPIEREGVNFIMALFDRSNCIFKEIHREHDYGHDAFVTVVDGTTVLPIEIALQIKSGLSYLSNDECIIPSTEPQRNFWCQHPLQTYGIVYDPQKKVAHWTDLKNLNHEILRKSGSHNIKFPKHALNKIDEYSFEKIFLPRLIGSVPKLKLAEAIEWSESKDLNLHYVGLVVLRKHFSDKIEVWNHFISLFESRSQDYIDGYLIYILAHLNSHGDIFFSGKSSWILNAEKKHIINRVKCYGENEIIKLLEIVDENGFERGAVGQSCGALIQLINDYKNVLYKILHNQNYSETIRFKAMCFLYGYFYIDEEELNALILQTEIDYYSPPSK